VTQSEFEKEDKVEMSVKQQIAEYKALRDDAAQLQRDWTAKVNAFKAQIDTLKQG
jgi:hypothetical protein